MEEEFVENAKEKGYVEIKLNVKNFAVIPVEQSPALRMCAEKLHEKYKPKMDDASLAALSAKVAEYKKNNQE